METVQGMVGMRGMDLLRMIKPDDLNFHAARYTSAQSLRVVVERAQTERFSAHQIAHFVHEIATACKLADGANYGSIPCLGGQPARVWGVLLSRYGRFGSNR